MRIARFYTILPIVGISTFLILWLGNVFIQPMQEHFGFALSVLGFFVLLCIGLFHAGFNAASSSNKYAFNNLISLSVFGKMVLSLALLFIYQRVAHPSNEWFVFIFLFLYVVFTVFEVWFMSKLARTT